MSSADQNGSQKQEGVLKVLKSKEWVITLLLRVVAFVATATATLVMGLNKETSTFVVATVGTTPIKATLTAKFQHTPAFVFFVIANAMASFHGLVMIVVDLLGSKFKSNKGIHLVMITILDMMVAALVSGGVTAAAFMAEVGKNGNSHARWNKICDKFDRYCDQGGGALIASFVGLAFLLAVGVTSIIKIQRSKPNPTIHSTLP